MKETKIIIPGFEFSSLLKLKIRKQINNHIWATVVGVFAEEVAASVVNKSIYGKSFQIIASDEEENQTTVFNGIIHQVAQHQENETSVLTVIAVSRSIVLESARGFRVFQDISRSYQSIVTMIAKNAGVETLARDANKAIGSLYIQYEESDWEFILKTARLANSFIVSDYTLDKPFIALGIPSKATKGTFQEDQYTVGKDMREYYERKKYQNKENVRESDYMFYVVRSREIFDLCSEITFLNRRLYIYEIVTDYIGGELLHKYTLRPKEGFVKAVKYNQMMQGVSLPATVHKAQGNKVQVSFDGDLVNDKKRFWFVFAAPYTAQGASGWYFMPDCSESVNIHFPTVNENDAYATTAPSEAISGDNPQKQILQTKHGHRIEFSEAKIQIENASGSQIVMSAADGVTVKSVKDINITAGANLTISAGSSINIAGDSGIRLSKGSSSITIEEDILIKGNRIKLKQ